MRCALDLQLGPLTRGRGQEGGRVQRSAETDLPDALVDITHRAARAFGPADDIIAREETP
jgi:hypothetical protein